MKGRARATLLSLVVVLPCGAARAANLSAFPEICDAGSGACTAIVTWTPDPSQSTAAVAVYGSVDRGRKQLLACQPGAFTFSDDQIQPGHVYAFSAYPESSCQKHTKASHGQALAQSTVNIPTLCTSTIGWSAPAEVCSRRNPCLHPTSIGAKEPGDIGSEAKITIPTQTPECFTQSPAPYPSFDDGPPLELADLEGTTRYFCEYDPQWASRRHPLPLVLFFHGTGGMASDVYNLTLLRAKAEDFDLSGSERGFHLVSVQARNLHDPTGIHGDGPKADFFHRDVSASTDNADIALADAIIDQAVASCSVDSSRIYVMGWSNGGHFAQLYAISRHAQPTPGGNYVAAAAIYSSGDPYQNLILNLQPSCQADPYPVSDVPIYVASRDCDLVACNTPQWSSLLKQGAAEDPSMNISEWISTLQGPVGDPNGLWQLIRGDGSPANRCKAAAQCSAAEAEKNHLTWPNGINDRSGIDYEPDMLGFLKDHPFEMPAAEPAPAPAPDLSAQPPSSPPPIAFSPLPTPPPPPQICLSDGSCSGYCGPGTDNCGNACYDTSNCNDASSGGDNGGNGGADDGY